ncbi:VRR-NUC domain-containing protein [Marinobacter daepoensis]|uniref:phosphodiesterase I n=1 Tax=Marinobacter daepoensis TaxID=262077 RepID=A0ABS3BDW4_9GAMM|nr:VRR-NUC domain-containing protein [Marinobacter daepoensis]MBN7769937.1 VRR-NUC domain-containing protein [Marinobacter daepoensis]MBY6080325.1 VRR-NUC domain-containing protein [Marinobacter daepoensis]
MTMRHPVPASLDNPLYYQENMDVLVSWVMTHHGDLLTGPERTRLSEFAGLETGPRALLTRMVMRTGELFRADKLRYPELPVPESEALRVLVQAGWLDRAPELSLDDLFRLFTLAELRPVFADWLQQQGHPKTLGKAQMLDLLAESFSSPRALEDWLPGGGEASDVVQLQDMALFDRIRLMFFGNLRQSWTDFVLVELGVQQFESVPFTPASRAFQQRAEVDCYLQMHQCRERLDSGEPAVDVWPDVPAPVDNAWLTSRRDRLLLELGRQAERQGEPELALQVWGGSGHRDAWLKQLRLLERMKRYERAWAMACQRLASEPDDAEAQGLARVLKRLAKKVGAEQPDPVDNPLLNEFTLTVPKPDTGTVELAALQSLSTVDAPVFYVENTLINALFGLLCWPVIFRPLPGAFFHPFHVGPADLTREDFVTRRQPGFDERLRLLETGAYRQAILQTFRDKSGIANPFVLWPAVNEALLIHALDSIPPAHLNDLFLRLLDNLREHRSGFPDLIRFVPGAKAPEQRYEMIEVKGPGDRLQDHQIRWLQFFARRGIPASVCYVRWQGDGECP